MNKNIISITLITLTSACKILPTLSSQSYIVYKDLPIIIRSDSEMPNGTAIDSIGPEIYVAAEGNKNNYSLSNISKTDMAGSIWKANIYDGSLKELAVGDGASALYKPKSIKILNSKDIFVCNEETLTNLKTSGDQGTTTDPKYKYSILMYRNMPDGSLQLIRRWELKFPGTEENKFNYYACDDIKSLSDDELIISNPESVEYTNMDPAIFSLNPYEPYKDLRIWASYGDILTKYTDNIEEKKKPASSAGTEVSTAKPKYELSGMLVKNYWKAGIKYVYAIFKTSGASQAASNKYDSYKITSIDNIFYAVEPIDDNTLFDQPVTKAAAATNPAPTLMLAAVNNESTDTETPHRVKLVGAPDKRTCYSIVMYQSGAAGSTKYRCKVFKNNTSLSGKIERELLEDLSDIKDENCSATILNYYSSGYLMAKLSTHQKIKLYKFNII